MRITPHFWPNTLNLESDNVALVRLEHCGGNKVILQELRSEKVRSSRLESVTFGKVKAVLGLYSRIHAYYARTFAKPLCQAHHFVIGFSRQC